MIVRAGLPVRSLPGSARLVSAMRVPLLVFLVATLVVVSGLLVLPGPSPRRVFAPFGGPVVVALGVGVALRMVSAAVVVLVLLTFGEVALAVFVAVVPVRLGLLALVVISGFVVIASVFFIVRPLYLAIVAMCGIVVVVDIVVVGRVCIFRPVVLVAVRSVMARSMMTSNRRFPRGFGFVDCFYRFIAGVEELLDVLGRIGASLSSSYPC